MKSKYETGSNCTPVNKTGINNVFCGYSKYKKFTRQRTLSVPGHILLKRLNQFVAAPNAYLDTTK